MHFLTRTIEMCENNLNYDLLAKNQHTIDIFNETKQIAKWHNHGHYWSIDDIKLSHGL